MTASVVLSAPDEVRALPCRTHDPDMWFAESPVLLEQAKRLCRECPVRGACLEGALARREPWGVWGGFIVVRGTILAYKRGRGRPPRQPSGVAAGETS